MATSYSATQRATTTTTYLRLWAQWLDALFAAGLSRASDTGQADFAAIVNPATSDTPAGYKVYEFADALAASRPVKVKLEVGCAGVGTNPAVWLTVGTGSDGAGNLTGVLFPRTRLYNVAGDATTDRVCVGSADSGRVAFALFLGDLPNYPLWWSLERRRDSAHAPVETGLVVNWGTGGTHNSRCLPFLPDPLPTAEQGLPILLSYGNANYQNDVGVGHVYPMLGKPEPKCLGVAVAGATGWTNYGVHSVSVDGTVYPYFHCGPGIYKLRSGNTDTNTRLLMAYW